MRRKREKNGRFKKKKLLMEEAELDENNLISIDDNQDDPKYEKVDPLKTDPYMHEEMHDKGEDDEDEKC